MNYSFHPKAEEEFLNAIDYYEEHKFGLGSEFAIEVYSTIANIINFPTAWPLFEYDIRKSNDPVYISQDYQCRTALYTLIFINDRLARWKLH